MLRDISAVRDLFGTDSAPLTVNTEPALPLIRAVTLKGNENSADTSLISSRT